MSGPDLTRQSSEELSGPGAPRPQRDDRHVPVVSTVAITLNVYGGDSQLSPKQIFDQASKDSQYWDYHPGEGGKPETLSRDVGERGVLVLARTEIEVDPTSSPDRARSDRDAGFSLKEQGELAEDFEQIKRAIIDRKNIEWALEQIEQACISCWTTESRSQADMASDSVVIERSFRLLAGSEGAIVLRRVDRISDTEFSGFGPDTLQSAELEVTCDRYGSVTSSMKLDAEADFDSLAKRHDNYTQALEIAHQTILNTPDCVWGSETSADGTVTLCAQTTKVVDGNELDYTVKLVRHADTSNGLRRNVRYEAIIENRFTADLLVASSLEVGAAFEAKLEELREFQSTPQGQLLPHVQHAMELGTYDKMKPAHDGSGVLVEGFRLETSIGIILCNRLTQPVSGVEEYNFVFSKHPHEDWASTSATLEQLHMKPILCDEAEIAWRIMESALEDRRRRE